MSSGILHHWTAKVKGNLPSPNIRTTPELRASQLPQPHSRYLCGMRLNEILTLSWEQVKLNQGYIELVNTKSNEKRYVILNETNIACLSELKNDSEYVFTGKWHQPLLSIRKPWARAKMKAKIQPEFRFHDLRHVYISHMIMQGVDLFTVAQQVGHKDLRLIQERYGHLLAEHRQKAARAIDGMFSPKESRHLSRHSAEIRKMPLAVSSLKT